MEDAATAEISRAQLWQWVRHRVRTAEGDLIDAAMVRRVIDEVVADGAPSGDARRVFEEVALADDFVEFLTLPAYQLLP
jgi:malate synthase